MQVVFVSHRQVVCVSHIDIVQVVCVSHRQLARCHDVRHRQHARCRCETHSQLADMRHRQLAVCVSHIDIVYVVCVSHHHNGKVVDVRHRHVDVRHTDNLHDASVRERPLSLDASFCLSLTLASCKLSVCLTSTGLPVKEPSKS